ncbi:hypothetical protein LCGC14_1755970 [marine sediment metagenome]|uniref:Uncharacterized protein n=1 Tax=marine sediment metagenome TaxID=412755 RepID=A0A0F9H2K4_9ZZZZ
MPTLCLILASGFWLLTGTTVATTIADVELTQHCIQAGTCREGNPLVPSDRKKVYAIQIPLTIGVSYLGHRLHQRGHKYWWVPQAALITGHGVGIGFGLRFVW